MVEKQITGQDERNLKKEMEGLEAKLDLLPPVKAIDSSRHQKLMTGIDPKFDGQIANAEREAEKLRRLGKALEDPARKKDALRYISLQKKLEK